MDSVNYSAFRKSMTSYLDQVAEDHKPVLITRRQGSAAVLLSLDDYHSIQETLYLMSSPNNARRINDAINEINNGNTTRRDLIDDQ